VPTIPRENLRQYQVCRVTNSFVNELVT